MNTRNIFFITLLSLFALNGFAQQSPPRTPQSYSFSLQDAINYAYQHNDSMKNAALSIKSANYQVKETIATGLPQINGSASFQYYFKPPVAVGPTFKQNPPNPDNPFDPANIDKDAPVTVFPFGPIRTTSVFSVQATQLLFSGTFIVGLQAVKTFRELSNRNFSRSKIETNVAVTKAYYQFLVNTEQIRLLDANIKQLKQQLDETSAQNKQGFVEKIDVDRLTVQYNNLVTNRENAFRSLDLANQMLKFQMGMPVEDQLTLTDKLEDVKLTQQIQSTADTGFYRNRIEYQLLETNITLNELDVKSKKAEFLPSLSLNGGVNYVFQENHLRYLFDRSFPNSYIGLSLNVPIFSSGLRLNQLRQKQINVEKAKNELSNAVNGFKLQANAANVTYANSIQSLNSQKSNQALAQEVLRVSRIKYQQGVGSSIEVSQAQTALEQANDQYIQALYNVLVSKVDLDKAYGRIQ
ncbi:TolC family protein [Mucilaginibacter limnophilus]|uniref:TolC family protein n=1 Tax=Mucilaginibacter limnophilus TaxID=1932778 RepID=A0A3S3TGL5_9SPHI|nr:TolC family protein [Mucilaginibacter limnophilus]RVU00578.1 TolC family protein [Mucilaginibacter limnophilus]